MSIQNFIESLTTTSIQRRRIRRSLPTSRLCLEPLEDRRLLSFAPGVEYAVGANPQAVATADFNNDGRLDVATANLGSNVSVLLGNAGGSFQPALSSPTGLPLLSLAVGDFNADGKLDLATTNPAGASTLLGNGNGTFQAPTNINLGSTPTSLGVGDFNGDGKLDLAVTTQTYYQAYYPYIIGGMHNSKAHVLLGNGGGSFSTPTVVPLDSYWGYYFQQHLATSIVSDFNGDGKHDFAFGNSQNGIIALSLGTVSGLGASTVFPSAPALAMAAGDVNADGKLDLVTKNFTGNDGRVLLGNGAGSFAPALTYAAGAPANSLTIADFNGDSKADLVMANGDGTVSVLLGTGAGAFRPPVSSAAGSHPFGVAVGDFNGDGRRDVATAVATGNSNSVSVLLNDGIWPALDAPSITIDDVSVTEGNSGTTPATFTVRLSAAYGQTVTVHYATVDGSATLAGGDYQAASGDLTFAPGVTSRTVTVLVNGDRLAAESESFYVRLTTPTNAIVTDALGAGTILDDEPYVNMGGNVQVSEGNTGTTSAVYTVSLSRVYDAPVSVNFSTAEGDTDFEGGGGPYGYYYYSHTPAATSGSDFQQQSGTLTFAPGETSKNITVAVNGDRLAERWEYFSVDLSSPSANASLGDDHALGTIADDEPRITVNNAQVVEGNSGTTNAVFIVTLSTASDQAVTVAYNTVDGSAGGSDYIAASGLLTFNPGQTQKAVSVAVKGDVRDEYDESFYLYLTAASGAEIVSSSATGTIVDNDPPPSLSISDASVVEGNSGTQLMVFTVTLSAASEKGVWVDYATSNGTAKTSDNDYVATSGSLFFAPGVTTMTISVVIKGDKRKEKGESFNLNLFNAYDAVFADAKGLGNILNDD